MPLDQNTRIRNWIIHQSAITDRQRVLNTVSERSSGRCSAALSFASPSASLVWGTLMEGIKDCLHLSCNCGRGIVSPLMRSECLKLQGDSRLFWHPSISDLGQLFLISFYMVNKWCGWFCLVYNIGWLVNGNGSRTLSWSIRGTVWTKFQQQSAIISEHGDAGGLYHGTHLCQFCQISNKTNTTLLVLQFST